MPNRTCLADTADETILFLACKNGRKCAISTLIFWKIFWGHSPQTPILGRGYGAPPQTPPSSALRRFAPPAPRSGPSVPPSSGRDISRAPPNISTAWRPWLALWRCMAYVVVSPIGRDVIIAHIFRWTVLKALSHLHAPSSQLWKASVNKQ